MSKTINANDEKDAYEKEIKYRIRNSSGNVQEAFKFALKLYRTLKKNDSKGARHEK